MVVTLCLFLPVFSLFQLSLHTAVNISGLIHSFPIQKNYLKYQPNLT